MSISIITPNDVVVDKGSVNTLVGDMERVDIPTLEEEWALLVYEEDFRSPVLAGFIASAKSREDEITEEVVCQAWEEHDERQRRARVRDHAMNSALSQGFTIDESSDGQERWAHLSA